MLRFSLFGFPVTIHWMFWVMAAVLGGGLNAKTPQQWQTLLVWVVAVFVSILVHELGHTFMQRRFGARAQIVLYAFGGLAIPDRGFTRGQHLVVSLAGPLVEITLGVVAWLILNLWAGGHVPWIYLKAMTFVGVGQVPVLAVFVACFAFASIFWGLFNLVPIMPLDGGHVLSRLLGPGRQNMVWIIGFLCAAGIAVYMLLVWRSLWNTILFGLLAWENLQRLMGKGSPPFLHP